MDKISATDAPKGQATAATAQPLDLLAELACTNTALRRASRRLGQLYDEAVASTGLKATQVGLLAQIANAHATEGEWPTLQALADRLAVSISALTHALRPLVRDGLIELRPDPHDGRTKHSALTALGDSRFREAVQLWSEVNQRVEQVLGVSAAALRALADDIASPEFLAAFESRRSFKG